MGQARGLLANSALFLAVSSLVSQLLGFLRDKFLSYLYGAGFVLDSYYAAFRVPEFMYLSIGSFVSSAILVPLFAKKLKEDDRVIWFQKLLTTFAVFFIIVYGIILVFLPAIIRKLYLHSGADFQQSVIVYSSILLFSTFFLSISSIVSSVAQEKRDFLRVGLAPVCYNLGTIIGIVLLRPFWGIIGVCAGVVIGSFLHMAVQLPSAIKMGLFHGYWSNITGLVSLRLFTQTIRKSFLRTISLAGSAVTFFLLTYFASLYPAGSITIISLAFTLQTVFHTLIGVSYATAVLPVLADKFVKKEYHDFDYVFQRGIKKMFLISFITTGLVVVFQYEIIYILFGGGKFNAENVALTAVGMGLFVLSLYAQNSILLFSRAAYARNDYMLPLVVNISTALFMYGFAAFAYNSTHSYIHTILSVPIAYSLAQYLALGISYSLYRKNKHIDQPYLSFGYGFKVLSLIILVTITSQHVLSLVMDKQQTFIIHIGISFAVFLFYIASLYILLGLIKDQHVIEDRAYIKSTAKRLLLALLPRRG